MPRRVVHVTESGLEADGELLRRGIEALQQELGVTPGFPAAVDAEAQAAAEATRSAASQGALYAALALILGAAGAFFGGRIGAVTPVVPVVHANERRV